MEYSLQDSRHGMEPQGGALKAYEQDGISDFTAISSSPVVTTHQRRITLGAG